MHANDDIVSERNIFNKKHERKSFVCVAVNPSVPIIWDLHTQGDRKLQKDTHTHTHTYKHTYTHTHRTATVFLTAHACGGVSMEKVNMHKNSQSYHRNGGVRKGRMQCGGEKQGRKEGGQGSRNVGM